MKDEKKVKAAEEVKTEEQDIKLTDEQLSKVTGGLSSGPMLEMDPGQLMR